MIKVSETPFDPSAEISLFDRQSSDAGAVVTFLGKVRGKAVEGNVRALKLEHYPGVTERSIADIDKTARSRWAIDDTLIIHRVGELSVGEPIVLVCVSAAHRRDAFEGADFIMDFLKTKAMFWKKEIRNNDEAWIEPRATDYLDADKWELDSLDN